MRIERFAKERFLARWDQCVKYDLAQSGAGAIALTNVLPIAEIVHGVTSRPLNYGPTKGSLELRSSVAELYEDTTSDHVLITNGAAEATFLVAWTLLERGDDVVVMSPTHMQLPLLARGWGCKVRPWRLREAMGWIADPEALRRVISRKTKAIFLCNPNNPTGAICAEGCMRAIALVAAEGVVPLAVELG